MELFKKTEEFVKKPLEEDLKKDIYNSNTFKESKKYLIRLLKKLEKDTLTDKEKEFLENELEKQKELRKLYDKYIKEKRLLGNKTKEKINNLFKKYKKQIIGDSNLDFIESQIENGKEKFEFFRDKVKECIDIKGELEDVYEFESTEYFINQFTIEYINFLNSKYEDPYSFIKKNDFTYLLLSQEELKSILEKIISNADKKGVKLNKKIEFSIIHKTLTIDLDKLNLDKSKDGLLLKMNKKEKYLLGIKLIKGTISKEELKKIKNTIQINNKNLSTIKKIYIKKVLLGEKIIDKSQLLSIMEKNEKNFNYLNFLNEFGLTSEIEKVTLKLIKEIFNIKIEEKNKDKVLYNLKIFLMFIIGMESDGRNICNNNSGAEGYFQYKWNNFGHKKNEYSSFEAALRRVSKFYTDSYNISEKNNKNYHKLPKWVKIAWKNRRKKGTIKKLSAEQQTILFLCDVFEKKGTNSHLENILFKGNQWSIKQIYKKIHHTNVKNDYYTQKRLEDKMKKFFRNYGLPIKVI